MKGRDLVFEEATLRLCCAAEGVDGDAFIANLLERNRIGIENYGADAAFMEPDRDNPMEAIDEISDTAAYYMMEVQKIDRLRDLSDPDVAEARMLLLDLARRAAGMDAGTRRVRELLTRP